MRFTTIILGLMGIAIDAFALSLLTNVSLSTLFLVGLLALMLSFGFEIISVLPIKSWLKFFLGLAILALVSMMFLIRELSEALLLFVIATLALSRGFILMSEMKLQERILSYFVLALVISSFPFSYALLAVYITYRASIENLIDTGRLAPLKKLLTYISGLLLLPINVFFIVAELFGVYEPRKNLYLIVLTILITVLLAAKRLAKERSKGKLGRLIGISLPALIGVYAGGYAMFKLNPSAAPVDGIAKSLAALAAILERPEKEDNFINQD